MKALAAAGWIAALALAVHIGGDDPRFDLSIAKAANTAPAAIQGKGIGWWQRRAVQARKDANARAQTIRRLRRVRLAQFRPPYEHAARLAALAYHVDAGTLIRKGRCETTRWTHFLNPTTGAAGPWQFEAHTWSTTPFARFSPYDPIAAALAAAYMHAVGRGSEWACR